MELLHDPKCIITCNEGGCYLSPQEKQILAKGSLKKVYNRTPNDEKECLTVLFTVAADGAIPPPWVLFSYNAMFRRTSQPTYLKGGDWATLILGG